MDENQHANFKTESVIIQKESKETLQKQYKETTKKESPEASKIKKDNINEARTDSGKKDTITEASKKKLSKTVVPFIWIDKVHTLKTKLHRILISSFESDSGFETAITQSLSRLINSFKRAAEYSNVFIDDTLKQSAKGLSDYENRLEIGVVFMKYCDEKDLFERLFRHYLAKRLLNLKMVNM